MSDQSHETKPMRCMNVSLYEIEEVLFALRSRYKYAIFTVGEPIIFPTSFPLDIMKICKLVGIYMLIPDTEKFLNEDRPAGHMEEDGFHLSIDAKISQE